MSATTVVVRVPRSYPLPGEPAWLHQPASPACPGGTIADRYQPQRFELFLPLSAVASLTADAQIV